MQVGVAAQEARREPFVDTQHVVDHEHLAVAARAGADADRRGRNLGGHARGQRRGNLFEHDAETARLAQQVRVAQQFFGLGLLLGADGVGSELVDRLGRQAEVSHDGNAGRENALDRFEDLLAALHLHGVGLGLLHNADGRIERHLRVALIGSERQVDDDQRPLHGTHDRTGVVDHHIEGDGNRGLVTGHHVGGRVAHENHVDTRGIDDLRHRIVVRGEHGDLLAPLFHLRQTVSRYRADGAFY